MGIRILNETTSKLSENIHTIYKEKEKIDNESLQDKSTNIIKNIISDKQIKEMFSTLQNNYLVSNMSYLSLAKVEESATILSENLSRLKMQIELDDFLSKGYNLDIDALKKKYKKKKINKEFPNLNFDKIRELYISPPKKLPTYYDEKQLIHIDSFVWRKYILAIIQMIFNHMDFVVCNIGDEGSGKSCKCSQDMYIIWWIMTEIGLIDYKFDINEMFANTLRRFSELEDKYYGNPFRIIGLDEGNELNRQDWKEDDVKLFWQRLRRERHERSIKFVNIPVLGEMILNIVLSRINFIFDMKNKNETKTGTLYKGDYDFYIIPRGDKIFSPTQNREISKEEVKNKLYIKLKDKEYLKGLPKEIRVKRCFCNGVWGFYEKDYIKELKETNRQYTISRGLKFGNMELFSIYKANITPKKLNVRKGDVLYPSLNKMVNKIKWFWNNDLDLLAKYENIFKQKEEEKNGKRKPDREKAKEAVPNLDTTNNM